MKGINQILSKFMNDPKFQETYVSTVRQVLNHPDVQAFMVENENYVSQEMIENSLTKLNEFVRETDLFNKGETGQNPGFRPRLFINGNYIDVTYVPTQQYYVNEQIRQQRQLLDNRMMSADVRNATFQDFYLNTENRNRLMTAMLDFIDQYKENPNLTQGLYLTGPFGVGKTYLLGALANQLVKLKKSVTMLHYPTFITEAKAKIADNSVTRLINQVRQVDVLIIDDIGAEANTVWVRDEVLTPILEYRMKESLPTFFSSNFNMQELEIHLAHTRDGGDESIKAKRIMERINYLADEVKFQGENLRHRRHN